MGAPSVDIHRKERDYKDLTLSDKNVVKYLILYRSKVDVAYNTIANINIEHAGDVFEFNQELIALYASLDVTIELCKFKQKQTRLLELIFEGHTLHDICNMDIGFKRSATYDLFDRMVNRIVEMNNTLWKECMVKQGYIKESQ